MCLLLSDWVLDSDFYLVELGDHWNELRNTTSNWDRNNDVKIFLDNLKVAQLERNPFVDG